MRRLTRAKSAYPRRRLAKGRNLVASVFLFGLFLQNRKGKYELHINQKIDQGACSSSIFTSPAPTDLTPEHFALLGPG